MAHKSSHSPLTFIKLVKIVVILMCPVIVFAGELDKFEESANRSTSSREYGHSSHGNSCISDLVGDLFSELIYAGIVIGGATSWERTVNSFDDTGSSEFPPRKIGDALIPFTRIDFAYQDIGHGLDAYDYRAEWGYGPVAVHFDQTQYSEKEPRDKLDLTRVYGLYRMSFGSTAEIDLGFGALTLHGNDLDSRFSFAMPILIHPNDFLGLELRPAWAANISDYDIAVLFSQNFSSLKIGYRWVNSPEKSLHGPYAGLSAHF